MAPVRVCVLVASPPPADPGDALHAAVEGLRARGHDVVLALVEQRPAGAGGPHGVAVEEALEGEYDVAVAASWEGAIRLFEVRAPRFVVWADGFGHERLGSWQAERIAAALAYDLPTDFVAAGPWVAAALRERRPDARVLQARRACAVPARDDAPQARPAGTPLRVAARRGPRAGRAGAPGAVRRGGRARPARHGRRRARRRRWRPRAAASSRSWRPPAGPATSSSTGRAGSSSRPRTSRGSGRGCSAWRPTATCSPGCGRGALQAARGLAGPRGRRRGARGGAAGDRRAPAARRRRWPVRLMADALAGVAVYRNDHFTLSGELKRVQEDRAVQTALRARDAWRAKVPEGARMALRRARGGASREPARRVRRPATVLRGLLADRPRRGPRAVLRRPPRRRATPRPLLRRLTRCAPTWSSSSARRSCRPAR